MEFKDRKGKFLNRKKLKVISQTPTEIIVDVERYDEPTEEGTKIDASVFNDFQNQINQANSTASQASSIAVSAKEVSNNANAKSDDAVAKSTQAVSDSSQAVATANESNVKSSNAVETSNTALQNSENAVQSANIAVQTSNNANTSANNALSISESASTTATEAKQESELANTTANSADAKSTTALANSEKAITDSEFAKSKALEVESKLADRGAAVFVGTEAQTSITFKEDPQSQLDNKLEKSFSAYDQKQSLSEEDLIVVQDKASNKNLKITIETLAAAIMNKTFPIGSVYVSVSPTNPGTLFGGVWEEFAQGRTLVGQGFSDKDFVAGSIGGESTHTLTSGEMPSHTHVQNQHTHGADQKDFNFWFSQFTHRDNQPETNFIGCFKNADNTNVQLKQLDYNNNTDAIGTGSRWGYRKVGVSWNHKPVIQNATGTNQNTGGGEAHNNLQPYVVTYMWRRIS